MEGSILENSACWSGAGEGKECAGSLLVMSGGMCHANPCDNLLMLFFLKR